MHTPKTCRECGGPVGPSSPLALGGPCPDCGAVASEYTPGPWTAAGLNQTRLPPLPLAVGALENGQNKAICSIFGFTDEDKANARLIAAAPALLEALEGLLDHIEQLNRGHAPSLLSPVRLDKARTAIAEAKGE